MTNAEFAAFVAATAHVSLAEKPLDPALYPDAKLELAVPGGVVFHMTDGACGQPLQQAGSLEPRHCQPPTRIALNAGPDQSS